MISIEIFCDSFYPEEKAVGIRLYHLANALKNNDFKVTVNSCTRNPKGDFNHRKNFFGAPSNKSHALVRLFQEFLLAIEFFFKIVFSKSEVFLLSSPPFLPMVFGAVASKLKGKKYIVDVRDEYPEVYFVSGLIKENSIVGKLLTKTEKFIYRHSFLTITVTENIVKKIITKSGNGNNKVLLVRNGFDEQVFNTSNVKEQNFTIVFHGNIGKFQKPTLIINLAKKALEEKQNIEFVVIGWGNNETALLESNLSNLRFLGKKSHETIPEIINKFHVGISVRTDDEISKNSFPVKIYEYLGVGLPIIVTPFSEAGSFVTENKLGQQFNGENENEIFNLILKLKNDSHFYQSLVNNILNNRQSFSRQKISNDFALLLKKDLTDA
jgi:glycosyltransferase involved in cell wall biosynthesis